MTDDLLTEFRSTVPLPTDQTARRAYERAVGAGRRTPRRRLALALAVAGLVLVPAGVAFGGKVADLFEGTPPPPQVSTDFMNSNRMADMAVQQSFASKFPHVDVSKVHGVIEIQTPDGPEDMWAAPNDQGGQSFLVDFANDSSGSDGVAGFGGSDNPGSESINAGDVWTYVHPELMTIYGSVDIGDAATVRIAFDDGSSIDLPVVEHLFLGSAAKGVKLETATAFDATGNELATRSLGPSGN